MKSIKTQRGLTLAITLVLLSIITLAAVSAMQNSGLQNKMTANYRHNTVVFNEANNALNRSFGKLNTGSHLQNLISNFDGAHTSLSFDAPTQSTSDINTQITIIYTGSCITCMKGFDLNQFKGISMEINAESHDMHINSSQYSGNVVVAPNI